MATIIDLAFERRRRAGTTFVFDLASPWTYLAGDAVATQFPEAQWVPATATAPGDHAGTEDRERVEDAAAETGIRFAWPRTGAPDGIAVARAASYAAEHDRAKEFALAAARLAYGWGEDLDGHELIARAAGIADLPLDAVVEATFDTRRDPHLQSAARDGAPLLTANGLLLDGAALTAAAVAQTSSMKTISVESERRGPSFRMRV